MQTDKPASDKPTSDKPTSDKPTSDKPTSDKPTSDKPAVRWGTQAVACKDWRWLPGMLTLCNVRITEGGFDYLIGHRSGPTNKGGGWVDTTEVDGILPDLSDPATLGCLLQLVREIWSTKTLKNGHTPVVGTSECDGMWEFGYRYGEVRVSCMWGQSEVEVLVWALENGP